MSLRGLDYAGAIAYALDRLGNELAPRLSYHNLWHTEHDVFPATQRLAQLSNLSEPETQLLLVAAAFHDIGWIDTAVEHERRGVEVMRAILPHFGFAEQEIERVAGMIMATRIPQSPHNLHEAILADADLDVLGRDDFLMRNQALRQELAAAGANSSDQEWWLAQQRFLGQHQYHTIVARSLRTAGKEANMARLVALFAQEAP
jgi:predicted metal-dependent HD superfamily phosphohydrolase